MERRWVKKKERRERRRDEERKEERVGGMERREAGKNKIKLQVRYLGESQLYIAKRKFKHPWHFQLPFGYCLERIVDRWKFNSQQKRFSL